MAKQLTHIQEIKDIFNDKNKKPLIKKQVFVFVSTIDYNYFIDYINSIKQYFLVYHVIQYNHINQIIKIIKESNKNTNNINNLYLFFKTIPTPLLNLILKTPNYQTKFQLVNTEQITRNNIIKPIINLIKKGIKIIDYSAGNIKLIKEHIPNSELIHWPYQPNIKEIYNYPKTNQVAFIGALSQRRKNVLIHLLRNNIPISRIEGWNNKRDQQLFRHKILLNIHHANNYNIFEELRCNRAILNKMIVISEKSLYNENHPLKEFMIECDYKDIPQITINTLKNYKQIHQNLFKNFNLEKITKKYQDFL